MRRLRCISTALVCVAVAFAGSLALGSDNVSAAPQYNLVSWQTDSGLPQNTVQAIVQTRDGYIWVGTGEGLARFDGVEFEVFNHDNVPVMANSSITALLEGPDASLWIGTDGGGLLRLKNGRFKLYSTEDGLASKRVRSLRLGVDGSVWIGCTSGLSRFKDERITSHSVAHGLLSNSVRALAVDRKGAVWIGTSRGTNVLRDETLTVDSSKGRLRSKSIRELYEERSGALWIATNAELERQQGEALARYTIKDGITPNTVECIYEDRSGTVWIGTNDGLYRFEDGRFVRENLAGAFTHERILTIIDDAEGNVWFGTHDGLKRIRRNAFKSYTMTEGLTHNIVTCVREDRDGALWIGTMGGGLNRFQNGVFSVYKKADGLISDRVTAVDQGADGSIWIGFDMTGLSRLQDGKFVQYKSNSASVPASANVIFEDRQGTVWFGTKSGLASFRDGNFTVYPKNVGDSGNIIRAITEDADGVVWIGTNRGITRYKDGQFTTLAKKDGLSHNTVTSLHADQAGVLWIGTDGGGLNWLEDGKFNVCTSRDGLLSDTIFTIVEDDLGTLWMSSRVGVFRVAKKDLAQFGQRANSTVNCISYGKADGMSAVEGSGAAKPGAWKSRDGRIWFATVNGLHVVDPSRITRNEIPPPVVISQVEVDGDAVSLHEVPRLPPGRGELQIHYVALSFAQAEKIRFKYRLVGVDRDWVDAGSRRIATYSGIKPGPHRFQVIARNNDGVWNRSGAAFDFYITPHFYQTWWFLPLVGAVVTSAAYGSYRLRVRSLRRREQMLSSLVDERTQNLNQEIAERRRVEEALKSSEALYHSLVEILPVNIYRKDREGRFTFVNDHFCTSARRTRTEIIGKTDFELFAPELAQRYRASDEQVIATLQPAAGEIIDVQPDGQKRWFEFLNIAVFDSHGRLTGTQGLFWDVTARKRAEEEVAKAQRELLDLSRQAGMAEVATGVLHNVGNVLNSVNISATIVADQVRESKAANLPKLGAMLQTHANDLANFLTSDPKGRKIPGYLLALGTELAAERDMVCAELEQLRKNIEHIKDIVAMQQRYAKISGVTEIIAVADLVEDALRMNASSLVRHGLEIVRDFTSNPVMTVDRHKVLQILVNLIRNAKYACDDSGRADKRLSLRIAQQGDRIQISVIDNGVGIPPENLTRIFAHGFTTRPNGHGFGLHSGALAAKEMGGSLRVHSEGTGCGATFTLELPLKPPAS